MLMCQLSCMSPYPACAENAFDRSRAMQWLSLKLGDVQLSAVSLNFLPPRRLCAVTVRFVRLQSLVLLPIYSDDFAFHRL